jgi:hypothetical protein
MKEKIRKSDLLSAIESIRLRAERQELADSLKTFVPVIDFNNLNTINTQIISGRNGTGKTHILRAYYQYCEDNYEQNKVLPVYIDCRDLELGPVLPRISLEELIIRFYRMFVRRMIERLRAFAEKVITPTLWQRIFGGEAKAREAKVEELLGQVDSILDLKQIEERLSEYLRTLETDKSVANELKGRIGVSTKFSLAKSDLEANAGLTITSEDVEKEKEKIALVYKGLAVIKYADIREALENVIDLCGASALVVLVDEWSSVSLSIQPVLAEMIRTTLAVSDKIALKIAASSYLTQTSAAIDPPQRIGLQPGVDVTQLADLDAALTYELNSQLVKDFLTTVAYMHTRSVLPELGHYSVKEFEDYLCQEVFDKAEDYLEVTRSSEGNSRDFIIVLADCCRLARMAGDKKISQKQAVRSASDYFLNTKAIVIRSDSPASLLYRDLFKKIVQMKQKLFLVSTGIAETDFRLQDLWNNRFVHLISKSFFVIDDAGTPAEYAVYSMDYGKVLTLKVHEANENLVSMMVRAARLLSQVSGPLASIISESIVKYLSKSVVGGKLLDVPATALVAEKGVEAASLSDLNAVAKNYIVDDLFGLRDVAVAERPKQSASSGVPDSSNAAPTPPKPKDETRPQSRTKASVKKRSK